MPHRWTELWRPVQPAGAGMNGVPRSKPSLFFASQSIEDPRVTNLIQVRHMVAAFSRYCDVTVVVKQGPGGVSWPAGIRVMRIPVDRTRVGNAVFGLKVYRTFHRERKHYDL